MAKTINRQDSSSQYLSIKEDTGSSVNWIHPKWVRKLSLDPSDVEEMHEFAGFDGSTFTPTKQVSLTLTPQRGKTLRDMFFVAPNDFPVDGVIVGTQFVMEFGHIHSRFAEKKAEPMLLMVQSKTTVGTEIH
jgi:hypothetical protein